MIDRRTHGILDYLVSGLLIAAPWLLGFAEVDAARNTAVAIGIMGLLYSLMTDYEYGMVRVIPFPTHLALDVGSGLLLAVSPWLFGFADQVYLPHLIVGLMEIGAAAMTRRVPFTAARTAS